MVFTTVNEVYKMFLYAAVCDRILYISSKWKEVCTRNIYKYIYICLTKKAYTPVIYTEKKCILFAYWPTRCAWQSITSFQKTNCKVQTDNWFSLQELLLILLKKNILIQLVTRQVRKCVTVLNKMIQNF